MCSSSKYPYVSTRILEVGSLPLPGRRAVSAPLRSINYLTPLTPIPYPTPLTPFPHTQTSAVALREVVLVTIILHKGCGCWIQGDGRRTNIINSLIGDNRDKLLPIADGVRFFRFDRLTKPHGPWGKEELPMSLGAIGSRVGGRLTSPFPCRWRGCFSLQVFKDRDQLFDRLSVGELVSISTNRCSARRKLEGRRVI